MISVGYLTTFFFKEHVISASPNTPAYGRQAHHMKFASIRHDSIDREPKLLHG